MLSDRGTDSALGSLDNVMKQLQSQDRFAFSQMLNKVMTGAMKIKNSATVAQIDREQAMRKSGDMVVADYVPQGPTKAEVRAQMEWASVMKWAKHRAIDNADAAPTPHVLMHKAPDAVSAASLKSIVATALKGRGGEARREEQSSRYWEALQSVGAVGNLFKGAAALLSFEHESTAAEVMARLQTKLASTSDTLQSVTTEYVSASLILTGKGMELDDLQERLKGFEAAEGEQLRLSHNCTTAMVQFATVATSVEAFSELSLRLPQGAEKVKFAKVAEAVVFLDEDNQLDKVVDEAEMDAAAMDEDGRTGGKEERQLARIVRKSYEEMDTPESSEEESDLDSDSDHDPHVEEEPFDPEIFAALQRIRQHAAVRLIQRVWRAYIARKMLELARLAEEAERHRALVRDAVVQIQRRWRGILGRRRFQQLIQQHVERGRQAVAAAHVQRIARGMLARQFCANLRKHGAATIIQRFSRGMLARRAWKQLLRAERLRLAELRRQHCAATQIQRMARGWLARRRVANLLDAQQQPLPVPQQELELEQEQEQEQEQDAGERWYEDPFIGLPIRFTSTESDTSLNERGQIDSVSCSFGWLGNHTPLGVEPPSWSNMNGTFMDSQIGGRDIRRDMPLKPKWLLAAEKGHKQSQPSGVRKGWVALRAAAPTMMVLLYVPETDSVQVLYVSGRREHVAHEVKWSELTGKPRVQDGRTLPNSRRTMYGLYQKAHGKCRQEQYLLSVDSEQWQTITKVRDSIREGLFERLANERSSSWSIGLGGSEDKRSSSGLVGFGHSGFMSTISRESFPSTRGSWGSVGLGGPQNSRSWAAAYSEGHIQSAVPLMTAATTHLEAIEHRAFDEGDDKEASKRSNHDALHPRISPTVTRKTSNFSLASATASEVTAACTECTEEKPEAVLIGLAEGRWSEMLRIAGVPEQHLCLMERTAKTHWQMHANGQAPTSCAPELDEMFATPTPPPPCRSGQHELSREQLRLRKMLQDMHKHDELKFRRQQDELMRHTRQANGRRHQYVQPFIPLEQGGSDHNSPIPDRSVFERSLGSVFSPRHNTTVPTLHNPGYGSATGALRLPRASSPRHPSTERTAKVLTAVRQSSEQQRSMTARPPTGARSARPMTSNYADTNRSSIVMPMRPSTAEFLVQDWPGGRSSGSADAEAKSRALSFLVSAAGTSKTAANLSLEGLDATGPAHGYIVPSARETKLVALPKLRLEPDRCTPALARRSRAH